MNGPFGYIPGFHLPGTLVPIGAIVEQQQQQQAEVQKAAKRRAALLLLLSK